MVYYPIDWRVSLRRECKRRRYSDKTAETYVYCINKFFDYCKKDIGKISKKDVREFLEHLSEKNRAGNTMNVYHMALRFLFEEVLDKRIWVAISYSKVPEKLPVVLTKDEVKKLFDAIKNEKHKLMIKLIYSAGLRVGELINLKAKDFEIDRGYGFVRGGKGGKDRIFIIADSLKNEIISLIKDEQLIGEGFLFVSNRDKKYDVASLQQIIKRATRKAGIDKKVHPHTLRHSFATHLIENGNSVSEVQSLLGHKSPETTFIYLHTASPNMIKIKSPIDGL